MDPQLLDEYRKQRAVLMDWRDRPYVVPAGQAVRIARYRVNTAQTINGTIGRTLIDCNLVRVRQEPDWDARLDDEMGDMFDPRANPELCPRKLESERKEYLHKAETYGFVGIISEVRPNADAPWETVDSCWGFEGWADDHLADEEQQFLFEAITYWMEHFELEE